MTALAKATVRSQVRQVELVRTKVGVIQAMPPVGVAISSVAGLLFLGSWAVAALSMYVVGQVASEQGVAPVAAAFLAAPALAVPIWKTLQVAREQTVESALVGHLWVLNGSAGWAVAALTSIWLVATVRGALAGAPAGVIIALLTAGFLPVFGALVALNKWLFGRSGQQTVTE